MAQSTRCKRCDAPIFFKPTNNGKGAPLDNAPVESGNVALLAVPGVGETAVTLGGETLGKARQAGVILYTSHFATCPHAEEFKGKGRRS